MLAVLMSMAGAKAFAYSIKVENADGVTIYYDKIRVYTDDGAFAGYELVVTTSGMYYSGEIVIPSEVTYLGTTYRVTSIKEWAFESCRNLTSVIIPNSITSIGSNAFWACPKLRSVIIGDGVTSIGDYAFFSCDSLTSVSIGNSVTSIGRGAFGHCSILPSITIPKSVKFIDHQAFWSCIALTDFYCYTKSVSLFNVFLDEEKISGQITLHVPADVVDAYRSDSWTMRYFKDIVAIESEYDDDSTINGTCGENVDYSYNRNTHTLTISGSGEMTNYYFENEEAPWFSYVSEIQNIEIGSGITTIGNFAFYKCCNVTSMTLPATVTSIGSSGFEECTSLTSLNLNEGLETLGGSALEGCVGLTSLTIPSTVNNILLNAIKNCKGLTDVYCYAEIVPNTDDTAFDGTPTETATLHVPANAIETYKSTWPWSDFKEIVALGEEEITGIMAVKQSNDRNGDYYDLAGRKVIHPMKGVFIRNGKKIFVKKY